MGRKRLTAGDPCAEAGGQPGSQLPWPGERAVGGVVGIGSCAAAMASELERGGV